MQEHDIREVIKQYDLGKIQKIESLTQGYANENFLVETDKQNVLYRICKQQPLHLIEYEVRLMGALRVAEFRTAFPIADKNGHFIQAKGTDHVMLYDFVQGEEPKLTVEVAYQIGVEVGKLSLTTLTPSLEKKNAIHIDGCHQLTSEFIRCKNQMLDIFGYFKEQTDYLARRFDDSLPRGIVHADIFPNNTIFNGGELRAIIDFEEACSDQLMFDVGMTINGFCFVNNHLQSTLLEAFLEGYNSQRKMTDAEWKALPIYMQWGSHGMLSWHLKNELINVHNQVQYERVFELMQRTQWMRSNENQILELASQWMNQKSMKPTC